MEAKKKILVVEDDDFFREAIVAALSDQEYSVIAAQNGKMAKDMMVTFPVDLVISDVQMPHMSGLELLTWIRQESSNSVPFILMTGFSSLLETKSAFEYGANEFLAKPFPIGDLMEKIEGLLAPPSEKAARPSKPAIDESSLCKVSIEDFVSDQEVSIDVYLKLSEDKFVKISHGGGKLSPERVENYKKKGLHYLHIKKTDFKKIVEFNMKVAGLASKSTKISQEKKERFIAHSGSVILEHAFHDMMDGATFEYARDFFQMSMDVVSDEEHLINLVEQLDKAGNYLHSHSIAVSFFSVAIAKKMGWTSPANQFKLAVGGMLHDIGKKEIEREILEKARAEMSFNERQAYESHALRGKEILESIPGVPSEIVAIAYEHHENCIGQGYPRKLASTRIHPLAKIVAVADAYCTLILPGPRHTPVDPQTALKYLFEQKSLYLPRALQALSDILKAA